MELALGRASVAAVVGDVYAPSGLIRGKYHPAVEWLKERVSDIPLLYVPGNHDYEGMRVSKALAAMRASARNSNVQVLWNETFDWEGVRYIGTPLWSDPRWPGMDPAATLSAVSRDSDLSLAYDDRGRPLDAHWLVAQHEEARAFVARELDRDKGMPKVVLTHWAPSQESQKEIWRKSPIAGYWSCDCSDLVKRANLWLHGHIHDSVDYRLGGDPDRGLVLSNPRGVSRAFNLSPNPLFKNPALVDLHPGQPQVVVRAASRVGPGLR